MLEPSSSVGGSGEVYDVAPGVATPILRPGVVGLCNPFVTRGVAEELSMST